MAIYKGNTEEEINLIQKLDGYEQPDAMESQEREVLVVFKSDYLEQWNGFEADFLAGKQFLT